MITALDSQRDRNAGLRSGADDFLSKPVNGTELRLRLQSLGKVEADHDLLDDVLPAHIARRLRNDPGYAADSVEAATSLFSDIKGFVPFSMGRSAASASRTTCGATL
jgi:DNA-binding response OmpR family regulator